MAKQMTATIANGKIKVKPNCPLNGERLTQCLVYKATYTTSNNSFVYYGATEREFKARYNNHTKPCGACAGLKKPWF